MKTIKKKNLFFFAVVSLIFLIKFDFFLNIYHIVRNDTESRLVSNYGYCYPLGYGFIKEINKKYNLNKYNINTKNKNIAPTSNIFNFSYKNKKTNYEVLINFKPENFGIIKKDFKVIENKKDCYLIKYLND